LITLAPADSITQSAIKRDISNDAKNISVSEMESLASHGANVYAAKGRNEDEIWVYLFKSSTGKFELFNRQKDKMNFISGDTEARIK
jgi:serine/threonine-protein kinase RIO1